MAKPDIERSAGQRLIHASCGAFLAALVGLCVQFWLPGFHWWLVGVCAAFGFVLGWFAGGEAIEFLKSVLWWT
jgi:hypothetical protein